MNEWTTITVDPGDCVLCDSCNQDYTDSEESGGILYGTYAIGPCCMEDWLEGARKYHEEDAIQGRCPPDKSFADWIREDIRQ